MQTEAGRVALVAGANGMVGRELLRSLTDAGAYQRVIALSRRPLPFEAPRLANRIVRFETLEQDLRGLRCDDAYCCLGTTLSAAGSQQAFRAGKSDTYINANWQDVVGAMRRASDQLSLIPIKQESHPEQRAPEGRAD